MPPKMTAKCLSSMTPYLIDSIQSDDNDINNFVSSSPPKIHWLPCSLFTVPNTVTALQ